MNISDITEDKRNWLSQETLTAYVVVNLAAGFPPLDLPIRDSVRLPKWRALREAVRNGHVPGVTNPPGSGSCLYSMLPLVGLMSFLAKPRLGPSWQWLRDLVATWAAVHRELYGVDPATVLKPAVSSQVSRDRCLAWLRDLMQQDPAPDETKDRCRQLANRQFRVTGRQFDRAWAIAAQDNPKWSAPGRRKGKPSSA